jgi:dipeptidyl aminopeptidase/acylaminoacyl peptidase
MKNPLIFVLLVSVFHTESFQAFNAAQLKGIPSKLLFFPEESHYVLKPQNPVLWQREFLAGWTNTLKSDRDIVV